MGKMTKAQMKRMVRDIESKSKKLFSTFDNWGRADLRVVSVRDMEAIEKLCKKWMNRIG